MAQTGPEWADDEPTLAETIRELANQPTGATWVGRQRVRLLARAERLTTAGPLAPLAELGWGTTRRLTRSGGSALAALIAYRLFVWLLPLALVIVSVLSLVTSGGAFDQQHATDRFGIAGYVAASVSIATADAGGPGFVTGVVFGGLFLLYATFALIRALRAVHALVWRVRLTPVASPLRTTLSALVLLVGVVLTRGVLDGLVEVSGPLVDLVLVAAGLAVYPAFWLVVSTWLPHGQAGWRELVPGAVAFAVGATAIHVLVVLVLFPYLEQKVATYGALGLGAGIMLALYGLGFVAVTAAALNAELHARTTAGSRPASQ